MSVLYPQNKLRVAVIGVGHLGKFHVQKYKLLDDEVDLVGVSDSRVDQGQQVAQEFQTKFYESPQALIGKVDAVTIAANTPAHFELGKIFLENRIHVHMEKPITSTSAQAEILCKLAKKNHLILQVGHVERFNPALTSVRERLNRPLFIECHRLAPFKPRSLDVDVVLDVMIHDLDVILSLVKSEPIQVSAVGSPVITKKVDLANARVEFASGTVANITASRVSQNTQRKFRVFQPDQYLSIDFTSGEVNLLTKTGEWQEGEIPLQAEAWNLQKGDALLAETKAFVASVKQQAPVIVSGYDGLVALKLAERILDDIHKRLS
ncbi:MAG: Gfo/Idh/MocA family oxidoreductase [Bdellovibrionales bacterium]|nr:Gfo/Idh/MocA family oxidoreductase [Bdellovibrionales bacterium]